MKVSELTGARLDYWVAKAEGLTPTLIDGRPMVRADDMQRLIAASKWVTIKEYSSNWAYGGPIIEREIIDLNGPAPGLEGWAAYCEDEILQENRIGIGPTPLIAAMRAYIYKTFGHEVPDTEE
jgi:hypothetical protein